METVIDTLVVKVDADTSSLRRVLAQAQEDFEAVGAAAESSGEDLEKVREQGRSVGEVLSEVFDNTVARMTGAFEDFLRTGEFSFSTLRNIALAALEDIASAVFENLGAGSDVFTGVITVDWQEMIDEYREAKKVQGVAEGTLYEHSLSLRNFERIVGKCNSK